MIFFLSILFLSVALFHNAYHVGFFSDDFAFFFASKIHSPLDIAHFFLPGKPYFYRPIPSELFYSLIRFFQYNTVVAHSIVFITFFIGLFFLYKTLYQVTKNTILTTTIVCLYALHLSHVFQLYALSTFQEVALFTFLIASFYFFLKERYFLSTLLFIAALMSKEIALFYPVFLVGYLFIFEKKRFTKDRTIVIAFGLLAAGFFLIYRQSLAQVSQLELYKIHLSPKLILNNTVWYTLWSLGFPSTLPSFFSSLFTRPLPSFFKQLEDPQFKIYLLSVITYLLLLGIAGVLTIYSERKHARKLIMVTAFMLFSFLLFISPALPIIHRWMVRLTVPLLFLSVLQGYILYSVLRYKNYVARFFAVLIVITYAVFNYLGVSYHEPVSFYFIETGIVSRAQKVFERNFDEITKTEGIYFIDEPTYKNNPYLTSEKLFTSFSDQHFLSYFFPDFPLKAYYEFKGQRPPRNVYTIHSIELLR